MRSREARCYPIIFEKLSGGIKRMSREAMLDKSLSVWWLLKLMLQGLVESESFDRIQQAGTGGRARPGLGGSYQQMPFSKRASWTFVRYA
jgi:hypothetical protein